MGIFCGAGLRQRVCRRRAGSFCPAEVGPGMRATSCVLRHPETPLSTSPRSVWPRSCTTASSSEMLEFPWGTTGKSGRSMQDFCARSRPRWTRPVSTPGTHLSVCSGPGEATCCFCAILVYLGEHVIYHELPGVNDTSFLCWWALMRKLPKACSYQPHEENNSF